MAWFEQFFPPGAFFPGGPAAMPNVFPITTQNTLPPRNQQRDEFMYGYGVRPPGVMPDVTGRPYPDLEIQRADSAPNWTSPGMPGIPPGVGPSAPPRSFMPASNPPPSGPSRPSMMPGTLPEGTNPPGAMGMGDLGYPGAMTPPANPQSAAPKPGFWERNADTLGPDGKLWAPLAALGRGLATPSWYGATGQLAQGLGEATDAAQKAPMQRAQRKLLEAQVGKAESETDARKQAMAIGRELPAGHPAKRFFQMGMIKEGLEKLEPDLAKDLVYRDEKGNIVVNQTLANVKAYIASAGAMKPQYGITGYDRDGKPVHGWTTPPTMPGATPSAPSVPPQQGAIPTQASTPPQAPPAAPPPGAPPARPSGNPYEIPPAPSGVNEAEWRKNWADIMSKRMAAEGGTKENSLQSADVVIKNIDDITKTAKSNWWATGLPGWLTKGIPGTPTHDMAQRVETVKANIAFDALARMRAASPTGGALGQVAIEELRQLQNSLAAMANSQSKEAFIKNMGEVRARYESIVKKYGGTMPQSQPPGNEGWKDMGDGYKVRRK